MRTQETPAPNTAFIFQTSICAGPGESLLLFDLAARHSPTAKDKPATCQATVSELIPRFDAKEGMYVEPTVVARDTFAGVPCEPFVPHAEGGDYFLVTRSGKLFAAPKPAPGAKRVAARVELPFAARYVYDHKGAQYLAGETAKGWACCKVAAHPAVVSLGEGFDPDKDAEDPADAAQAVIAAMKELGKLDGKK